MKYALVFFVYIFTFSLNAQNKPVYPEPKDGFKRVDLILPKAKYIRTCNQEIQEHIHLKNNMSAYMEKNYYIDNTFGYNIEHLELRNTIDLTYQWLNHHQNQNDYDDIPLL